MTPERELAELKVIAATWMARAEQAEAFLRTLDPEDKSGSPWHHVLGLHALMTTNTPRKDACPHCGAEEHTIPACVERQARMRTEAELATSKAEVAELNRFMVGWKQRATMSEMDLEASRAEVERLKEQYEFAAESVARMHEAAIGEIRGPIISVIEDIKAVRERAEKAEAESESRRVALVSMIKANNKLEAEVERLHAQMPDPLRG